MPKRQLPPDVLARHRAQGQLPVKCHRVYKASNSINVLLTPTQAMELVSNLMKKTKFLVDEGLSGEWTIQMWSAGGKSKSVRFGLKAAPKKERN